jgi:hypothetical protein
MPPNTPGRTHQSHKSLPDNDQRIQTRKVVNVATSCVARTYGFLMRRPCPNTGQEQAPGNPLPAPSAQTQQPVACGPMPMQRPESWRWVVWTQSPAFVLFLFIFFQWYRQAPSLIILSIFSVVFFVVFGLALLIFTPKRQRSTLESAGSPEAEPRPDITKGPRIVLIWSVLLFFEFLLLALAPSLVFGVPLPLQSFLAPDQIIRKDIQKQYPPQNGQPAEIPLNVSTGFEEFFKPVAAEGEEREFQDAMAHWGQWIQRGATLEPADILVYTQVGFKDYYKPFNSRLVLSPIPSARLTGGVAFVERMDPLLHERVFRQLHFWVDEKNSQSPRGEDAMRNALEQVVLGPNDRLVIVVKFTDLDKASNGGKLPKDCKAKLVLRPERVTLEEMKVHEQTTIGVDRRPDRAP